MMSAICRSRILKIATASLASVTLLSGIAAASDKVSFFSTRPDVFAAPDQAQSEFLAGYRTKKTVAQVADASNTFTVPSLNCRDPIEGIAIGIGNEKRKGSPTLIGVVNAYCWGSPVYQLGARAGQNTAPLVGGVSAGDKIDVTITQNASTVTVTVSDTTSGATAMATGTPIPDNQITFGAFPMFYNGSMMGVPDFGSVQLKTNKLNSEVMKAHVVKSVPRVSGGTMQIAVGALSKGAFTLGFENH